MFRYVIALFVVGVFQQASQAAAPILGVITAKVLPAIVGKAGAKQGGNLLLEAMKKNPFEQIDQILGSTKKMEGDLKAPALPARKDIFEPLPEKRTSLTPTTIKLDIEATSGKVAPATTSPAKGEPEKPETPKKKRSDTLNGPAKKDPIEWKNNKE